MDNPTDKMPPPTRDSHLADLGELAGPLAHEFNNLLNNLTLHLEIMKQKAPAALVADFAALRRQVMHTAAQVMNFQRYQRAAVSNLSRIDLNEVLSQATEWVTQFPPRQANGLPLIVHRARQASRGEPENVWLWIELENNLPQVSGYVEDCRRVCRFLLSNAMRAAAVRGGAVMARTMVSGASAQLVIEDNGPDVPTGSLPHLFELGKESREGMSGLELAACRSIVRRLQGHIEAQPGVNGGLTIVVTFPG
jgi:signal transduction histidine kinase